MTRTIVDPITLYYITARKDHADSNTSARACLSMIRTQDGGPSLDARIDVWRQKGYTDIRLETATGLPCSIYRDTGLAGDFSNGGLSSRHTRVTLVGPDVYELTDGSLPTTPRQDAPAVFLDTSMPLHTVVRPVKTRDRHAMFGGTFIWTSDSRFRAVHEGPIPLHDRHE